MQKHEATRLHWDFRLEADGVLKSWAVTKGPSPDPEIKRLAVRTEDHPMAYAEFEGTIPAGRVRRRHGDAVGQGDLGAGRGQELEGHRQGHLHFTLDGERMKGEWLLIRLEAAPRGEARELAAAQAARTSMPRRATAWSSIA